MAPLFVWPSFGVFKKIILKWLTGESLIEAERLKPTKSSSRRSDNIGF